ncbi:unnamed protein product [Parnassius mnemosyne]|uniref:Uncharacterized protein n=1 Tax=Parnassius mnemosyne TaxID=213953 RepID=A0AAV1M0R4_9NEOP
MVVSLLCAARVQAFAQFNGWYGQTQMPSYGNPIVIRTDSEDDSLRSILPILLLLLTDNGSRFGGGFGDGCNCGCCCCGYGNGCRCGCGGGGCVGGCSGRCGGGCGCGGSTIPIPYPIPIPVNCPIIT